MKKNKKKNKKPGLIKKILDLWLYWVIASLGALIRLFPLSLSCRLGEKMGKIWFFLDRRHRLITLDNLHKAFGRQLSGDECLALARKTFAYFGRMLMECMALPYFTKENIRNYVDMTGLGYLAEAEEQGRGLLILLAHFANWELLALAFGYYGFPSTGVARPLDNPYLNQLVDRYRTMSGNSIISKRGAVKETIQRLRREERVGILMDQNTHLKDGVFVDFFGSPASTTPILAALSMKMKTPVLPLFLIPREEGYGYHLEINKPVNLITTGHKENDLLLNTALFTKIIEEYIRKYPHCWFWMHRRWKTKPEAQLRRIGKIRQLKPE